MEKVILGRKYSHPFAITGRNVSREHCELTRDGDIWTIRDLGSRHGTFIQDGKNGKLVPVDGTGTRIEPFTLICLGGISVEGCTFYAYNVFFPRCMHPFSPTWATRTKSSKERVRGLRTLRDGLNWPFSLPMPSFSWWVSCLWTPRAGWCCCDSYLCFPLVWLHYTTPPWPAAG